MSTVILVNECLMVAIVKQKEKQSMNIYGIALWNSLSIRRKINFGSRADCILFMADPCGCGTGFGQYCNGFVGFQS